MVIESYIIGGALLLLLSIITSKATGRLGIPALLVFLGIGMLAGSEGIGGIHFDDPWLAQTLGVIALIFILFAGGLDTAWDSIRPVMTTGAVLATAGVFLTSVLTGWFATAFLGFSLYEGMLLGAIVSSTDAAAVFAVLRSRNVSLRGKLKPLLELESGSNDPMAVFLTIGMIGLSTGERQSLLGLIPAFFQQMAVGAFMGWAFGSGTRLFVNRIALEYEGLYPVSTVCLVLLTYGLTQVLGGNGFLAVYVAGLVIARGSLLHKRSLTLFHDGLAWLMQIAMFLVMGLLVFPSRLIPVIGTGLLLSAFLIFIARPVSMFIALSRSNYEFREKAMISWVGLRGSVPIILATYPLLAGVPKADTIFNLVFFIVLTSVLLQGTSIPLVAKWLGVDAPLGSKVRFPLEYIPGGSDPKAELTEIEIHQGSAAIGKAVMDLAFPKEALIVLIQRGSGTLVPRGNTRIEPNDRLLLLAEREALAKVRAVIGQSATPTWKRGAG